MHPPSKVNGRCKLDHTCSKEQGITIKQYEFSKPELIHTPLDSSSRCHEHVVCTTAGRGTGKPQIPANLAPFIQTSLRRAGIDDPCSWSPPEFCKTPHLHNRIINTENSFNHLLCSDAQG
ncbi:hypothetical protein AMECASPLE_020913 [Ameca splendens]|uniref:Uncharacterized protein n=1 Tax=Ameca splendens TaxID=208324 RepID=A0ABV0XGF7_9TELE